MVHLVWMAVATVLLFTQYRYKQDEINDLRDMIKRGREYVKEVSQYFTEKNINTEGKLKIYVTSSRISEDEPLVFKIIESDGTEQTKIVTEKHIYTYIGTPISRIESISGHPFRFASDFEVGMENQEPTVYTVYKKRYKSVAGTFRMEQQLDNFVRQIKRLGNQVFL